MKTAVPAIGGIAVAAVGIAALNACCNGKARKVSAFGILPIGMAALTATVAAWAYLNPDAIPDSMKDELDDLPLSIRKRIS
ncbi:MAG: hypothetical protein AAGD32_04030 [Planctomycetota bacterium]